MLPLVSWDSPCLCILWLKGVVWTSGLNVSGIALLPRAAITNSSGLGVGPKLPTSEVVNKVLVENALPMFGTTLFVTVVAVTLSSTIIPRPL